MQALTAISPIDGRYRDKVDSLANYFSESALIRYRVMVEVEYFIALSASYRYHNYGDSTMRCLTT